MKWTYAVLIALGVVAAAAAAVLVASLQARPPAVVVDGQPTTVHIVQASRDLEPMTVVDASAIEVREVSAREAPAGAMAHPAQVVGKVLGVAMKSQQAFTKNCFASEGAGLMMASALPQGKRAVSVSLSDYSGLDGLLYPGSIVDILVCFDDPDDRKNGVSRCLLGGVPVLAVEGQTVLGDDAAPITGGSGQRGRRRVTLLVDPPQAQALQLAQEKGTISLAMRNPMDRDSVSVEATLLSDLVSMGASRLSTAEMVVASAWPLNMGMDGPGDNASEPPPPQPRADENALAAPAPRTADPNTWDIQVIRGTSVQTQSFPIAQPE